MGKFDGAYYSDLVDNRTYKQSLTDVCNARGVSLYKCRKWLIDNGHFVHANARKEFVDYNYDYDKLVQMYVDNLNGINSDDKESYSYKYITSKANVEFDKFIEFKESKLFKLWTGHDIKESTNEEKVKNVVDYLMYIEFCEKCSENNLDANTGVKYLSITKCTELDDEEKLQRFIRYSAKINSIKDRIRVLRQDESILDNIYKELNEAAASNIEAINKKKDTHINECKATLDRELQAVYNKAEEMYNGLPSLNRGISKILKAVKSEFTEERYCYDSIRMKAKKYGVTIRDYNKYCKARNIKLAIADTDGRMFRADFDKVARIIAIISYRSSYVFNNAVMFDCMISKHIKELENYGNIGYFNALEEYIKCNEEYEYTLRKIDKWAEESIASIKEKLVANKSNVREQINTIRQKITELRAQLERNDVFEVAKAAAIEEAKAKEEDAAKKKAEHDRNMADKHAKKIEKEAIEKELFKQAGIKKYSFDRWCTENKVDRSNLANAIALYQNRSKEITKDIVEIQNYSNENSKSIEGWCKELRVNYSDVDEYNKFKGFTDGTNKSYVERYIAFKKKKESESIALMTRRMMISINQVHSYERRNANSKFMTAEEICNDIKKY